MVNAGARSMLKYVVVLILSLTQFAIPANSQLRAVPANVEQIQKIAADREATNNALSSDPHQLLQQELIARAVADRQSQLRLDTEKLGALTAALKRHVDKAGAKTLSNAVLKEARDTQTRAK